MFAFFSDYSLHNSHKKETTETMLQSHSTPWPPSELFPLNPTGNGVVVKPNENGFEQGVIDYTQRPDLIPGRVDPYNGGENKPFLTGKSLPDSHHGRTTGIKEAMSITCSGTFVTVCTFSSHFIISLFIFITDKMFSASITRKF